MIFAFTNSKGGVGKSTLSVHLTVWLHVGIDQRDFGTPVVQPDSEMNGKRGFTHASLGIGECEDHLGPPLRWLLMKLLLKK